MKQYRILTDNTVDGLLEQINQTAEQGFILDKFDHSGTADVNWQGVAVMVIDVDVEKEFDYVTPQELKEVDPEAKDVFLIRNSGNFPLCECYSTEEAEAICDALNKDSESILNSML